MGPDLWNARNQKPTCASQNDNHLLALVVVNWSRCSRLQCLHPPFKVLKQIGTRGESLMLQARQRENLA